MKFQINKLEFRFHCLIEEVDKKGRIGWIERFFEEG
jgi:hypothetical protein